MVCPSFVLRSIIFPMHLSCVVLEFGTRCEILPETGMTQRMNIIIIGGGIAGLSFALALKQRGLDSRVYETVPELKPLGVGISLLPHAMREFSALGLEPAIR